MNSTRDWAANAPNSSPAYKSTALRAPQQAPIAIAHGPSERSRPRIDAVPTDPYDADLTKNAARDGAPLGERIIVSGKITDDRGRAQSGLLIEIWQANAAGRYIDGADQHDAPLDPNFLGAGRCISDAEGRYQFTTVKPGAYPWGNHHNGWRPAHIHFSLLGGGFASRLITQMYFPGDPLLALDPIFAAVPTDAQSRLVANFSLDVTCPMQALGYQFDMVLAGPQETPRDDADGR
ncbi:MAG: protocatechuate 3,4-dioxygenase subunit beta [Pseudomonadota bacterium]